ncbi:MAG TPA: ClcB-like voltage-gated chloride channel protein [Verrucomicrobiae bacterium]|nr:ClcB-like voltage-gated chloride channel protein [Verrucomicrobiae bacterium]
MQAWFNNGVTRARNFLHRHWQRALLWREKLVPKEEAFHLLIAAVVGVIGGCVNVLFFYGGEMLQRIFLSQPGDPVKTEQMFTATQRVLVPAIGGLVAGLILHFGLRWAPRQDSSDMLEVVVAGDGRLRFRRESVKTGSALVSIATGASIGREGGIVQLSATLASKLGQLFKWPPYRLRLLVGCGAAAGMAAAYNAPIGAAVFAALIVLGNFSMNLLAPLVCASVISTVVSRSVFGMEPWYQVPHFPDTTMPQLAWFFLMGILCGGVSAVFLKLLGATRRQFDKIHLPVYVKLALAGGVVGVIALQFPGVVGNGYFTTNSILRGKFEDVSNPFPQLSGLFLGKILATVVAVGAGTVGGVFTPTLFLGACSGSLFGAMLHSLGFSETVPVGAFALVGMGAVLSGTTKSPLLAIIMLFEISLDYSLMPALMLACVVSVLVARQLYPDSVYSEHMRLKGLPLHQESDRIGAAMENFIGDMMREPVPPVRETASLRDIAGRFLTGSNNFLPIVNDRQQLVGVIALHDLKEFLNATQDFDGVIAYDVMRPPPKALTPAQRLLDALPVVLESELRNVPVVNNHAENRLIGSVSRTEILELFSEAIAKKSNPVKEKATAE